MKPQVSITMFTIKTGPVRTSGFALKLRRAANAALRELYKEGKVNANDINKSLTEVNKMLYELIISEFSLPKDAVVNITLSLDIDGGKIVIKDIFVEVFGKDEILSKAITKKAVERLVAVAPTTY